MNDIKILRRTDNYTIAKDNEDNYFIEYYYKSGVAYGRVRLITSEIDGNIAKVNVYSSGIESVCERHGDRMIARLDVSPKKVSIEWYFNLLLDDNYVEALMMKLLDIKRVSKYLEGSTEEYKYIGGIREINGEYKKYFDRGIDRELSNKAKKEKIKRLLFK